MSQESTAESTRRSGNQDHMEITLLAIGLKFSNYKLILYICVRARFEISKSILNDIESQSMNFERIGISSIHAISYHRDNDDKASQMHHATGN